MYNPIALLPQSKLSGQPDRSPSLSSFSYNEPKYSSFRYRNPCRLTCRRVCADLYHKETFARRLVC
ncbi:hypothetical protein HMPREF1989_01344, partial [Porphyromonas gingivalis F0566]